MSAEKKDVPKSSCRDEGDAPLEFSKMLVDEKGFGEDELETGLSITTEFNNETVLSRITLVARIGDRRVLILRYAPGSIVTRTRAAVAAARVLDGGYQIPFAVVTNGREVEMLDTYNGKILAKKFADIPTRQEFVEKMNDLRFEPFQQEKKRDRELRILNVFDVDL